MITYYWLNNMRVVSYLWVQKLLQDSWSEAHVGVPRIDVMVVNPVPGLIGVHFVSCSW